MIRYGKDDISTLSISIHCDYRYRDKRDDTQEIVEANTTGRSITTDYEKRTKDETIVPDWKFIRRQTKIEVLAN